MALFLLPLAAGLGLGSLGTYFWATSTHVVNPLVDVIKDIEKFDITALKHVERDEPKLVFTASDMLVKELNSGPPRLRVAPARIAPITSDSEFIWALRNRFRSLKVE
jgi:hypothetical protein